MPSLTLSMTALQSLKSFSKSIFRDFNSFSWKRHQIFYCVCVTSGQTASSVIRQLHQVVQFSFTDYINDVILSRILNAIQKDGVLHKKEQKYLGCEYQTDVNILSNRVRLKISKTIIIDARCQNESASGPANESNYIRQLTF